MPIYEYECQVGHRFERRQSFHDEPLRECVECGQPARRLLSPAGIIFKGSGWYITDSRKGSPTESGDKTDKADKAEKSDTSAPAESKPAEKATTSTED